MITIHKTALQNSDWGNAIGTVVLRGDSEKELSSLAKRLRMRDTGLDAVFEKSDEKDGYFYLSVCATDLNKFFTEVGKGNL